MFDVQKSKDTVSGCLQWRTISMPFSRSFWVIFLPEKRVSMPSYRNVYPGKLEMRWREWLFWWEGREWLWWVCIAKYFMQAFCSTMVRASHWSSEGHRLYTYVTFIYHLSPCSSMVRASHWSSEGYRLYTYVTFTHHLSPCSSMVRTSHWSPGASCIKLLTTI